MYSKKYDIIHTEIIIFLDFKSLKDTAITHVWVIQLIGAMVTTAAYLGRVGNNTVLTYTRHCII